MEDKEILDHLYSIASVLYSITDSLYDKVRLPPHLLEEIDALKNDIKEKRNTFRFKVVCYFDEGGGYVYEESNYFDTLEEAEKFANSMLLDTKSDLLKIKINGNVFFARGNKKKNKKLKKLDILDE